jgi:protein O-GlcNAc transferase
VTDKLADYEALALKLATEKGPLRRVKDKLARNRLVTPLFDTDRLRRHMEAAYLTMWECCLRGEEPKSFVVPPVDT